MGESGRADGTAVGATIRAIRTARRRRQKDVAQAAGISPSYLALIEAGRRTPPPALRRRLAAALGLPESGLRTDGPMVGALVPLVRGWTPDRTPAALVAQFPEAAQTIVDLSRKLRTAEARALGARSEFVPLLAAHLHELIAAASSINTTAAILEEDGVDANWRRRFARNIGEDAARLQAAASALSEALHAAGQEALAGSPAPHDAGRADAG